MTVRTFFVTCALDSNAEPTISYALIGFFWWNASPTVTHAWACQQSWKQQTRRTIELGVDGFTDVHLCRLRGDKADETSPLLFPSFSAALVMSVVLLTVRIGDIVVVRSRAWEELGNPGHRVLDGGRNIGECLLSGLPRAADAPRRVSRDQLTKRVARPIYVTPFSGSRFEHHTLPQPVHYHHFPTETSLLCLRYRTCALGLRCCC